jgi:long-chain acyl-CoA synthetase
MNIKKYLTEYKYKTAVIASDNSSYSYEYIDLIAKEIYTKIGHRSLVFCLCTNTIGSLIGYVSFINNRVIPLMLDASMDKGLLENLISTYNPEYIWFPTVMADQFTNEEIIYSILGYSLIKLYDNSAYELHDDLALLLTTSGSTGSPKLVRLSYNNLLANASSISEYLSIDENEKPITSLPMNYSFGLSIINSHLLKGATILLTEKSIMEKEFWSFFKAHRATSISGVPFTYEMLKKLRLFSMSLPSLKTLTQAGGKLNEVLNKEYAEYCLETGRKFFVMYGQTEATARMSYLPSEYSLMKLGSMGIAIPGGEFSLIDERGVTIEENNWVGELVYKGPNVSLGYAECVEDLSLDDENKGILITGDMAKRDDDGYYYIVGRKKRFVKIYGNRINLDETERLLKNIITECACSGRDDRLEIFVTEKDRNAEIISFISSKMGIHRNAFVVIIVKEIPKNSSGKTIYSLLKE